MFQAAGNQTLVNLGENAGCGLMIPSAHHCRIETDRRLPVKGVSSLRSHEVESRHAFLEPMPSAVDRVGGAFFRNTSMIHLSINEILFLQEKTPTATPPADRFPEGPRAGVVFLIFGGWRAFKGIRTDTGEVAAPMGDAAESDRLGVIGVEAFGGIAGEPTGPQSRQEPRR